MCATKPQERAALLKFEIQGNTNTGKGVPDWYREMSNSPDEETRKLLNALEGIRREVFLIGAMRLG